MKYDDDEQPLNPLMAVIKREPLYNVHLMESIQKEWKSVKALIIREELIHSKPLKADG